MGFRVLYPSLGWTPQSASAAGPRAAAAPSTTPTKSTITTTVATSLCLQLHFQLWRCWRWTLLCSKRTACDGKDVRHIRKSPPQPKEAMLSTELQAVGALGLGCVFLSGSGLRAAIERRPGPRLFLPENPISLN